MLPETPPYDWWPEWLRDFASEGLLASSRVVVAQIEETTDEHERYRQLFTALVPVRRLTSVLEHPGGIGYGVSASGPHPLDFGGTWDSPRFWIESGGTVQRDLEPLVVSWKSGREIVLWPDQGFLMTYGLVPRLVAGESRPTVHWDDPTVPRADVIVASTVSSYSFPAHSGAYVTVERDFLQDYATIRKRALVQVYYVQHAGPLTEEIRGVLGSKQAAKFDLPGRQLDLRMLPNRFGQPVLAQVWGVRPLIQPGPAPISAGRRKYGSLVWPGFPEPIAHESALRLLPSQVAYVRDSVLGMYEGRPEFTVHPESGSVSYRNQWSISPTRRVGRDLIAVGLKKLYEGNQAETVHHWHAYAVPPPPGTSAADDGPNVGTRARRIVYGLVTLGGALAELAPPVPGQAVSAKDFVGLDGADLRYHEWWKAQHVEPITWHIPSTLPKAGLLTRCNGLYMLIGEGLVEARLRGLLIKLDVPSDDIKGFRSLNLLDHVVRLAELAVRSGHRLHGNGPVLHARLTNGSVVSPIARLLALHALRQLNDHRAERSEQRKFRDALKTFGLDPAAYVDGWGTALDAVYDGVGQTLEAAAATLTRAAREQ